MNITFATKKLEKLANDLKKSQKELGKSAAERYNLPLSDLRAADTLEDVRNLAGRYHELTGNRKGLWACDLEHPYRLIFRPHEDPIPQNADSKYLWVEILGVEIVEITDYH